MYTYRKHTRIQTFQNEGDVLMAIEASDAYICENGFLKLINTHTQTHI